MANCFTNDVFLSFRGEDTRHSFTGFLYDALSRKGINAFMDHQGLNGGDHISQALLDAIRQSTISIVVFSENYASSQWCLEELVEIVECMRSKKKQHLVLPIFYKVAPSDVRHQRNSYFEAMMAHEERLGDGSEKVQRWRSALSQVAELKGWHYQTGYEYEFIEEIMKNVTPKLQREELDVGELVIGHKSRIEEVMLLLDIESKKTVYMLGIHGTGGMGKTTLVKALYNSIIHRFECAVFLEDIRERSNSYMGLVHLQEAILSKLFEGENIKLGSVSEGVTRLKDILQHKRVLLVLDDVDSEDQLEKLAGNCDWFDLGSRIIITTRDKHILDVHGVEKRYEMKGLNDHEALQLFCGKAFKMSQPAKHYEDVSNHVVHYADGLPLALKVIGSYLANRSVKECESALKQYARIPERKIQDILRISYDCLDDNAKNVFLDIACFFKRKRLEYVQNVLEKCDFFPEVNIKVLVDKSLLAVEDDCLRMHDLIQDMGREIVRQEVPSKPGERSRLYFYQDVLRVLRENSGSSNIEGIMLDPPEKEEVSGAAFEKMSNLRYLIVRNTHFISEPNYLPNSLRLLEWKEYPSKSLPSDFNPRDIVDLSLPCSHLCLKKETSFPKMMHLTYMNFSRCEFITYFPDVSGVPNLRRLELRSCENLNAIHPSVGFLKELKWFDASRCYNLEVFLPRMWLPSLQHLSLKSTRIASLPHIEERMNEPLNIVLCDAPIKELPDSIGNLTGLRSITMKSESLTLGGLPSDLFMLPKIGKFILKGCNPEVGESFRRFLTNHVTATTGGQSDLRGLQCSNCGLTDEDLDAILRCFPKLRHLDVRRNEFVSLPASIKDATKLEYLHVTYCEKLEEIPELPSNIQRVQANGCLSLSSEASRMLWSQALNEVYKLSIVMPKITEIPSWFDHQCDGLIVSFWARRKFPVVAFAFIVEECTVMKSIRLRINDIDIVKYPNVLSCDITGEERVVLVFDLRRLHKEWASLDTFLVSSGEWNYVQVECEYTYSKEPTASYCGAYVYKGEANMEDIRFTCPDDYSVNKKRTLSIVDDHDNPTIEEACGEAQA